MFLSTIYELVAHIHILSTELSVHVIIGLLLVWVISSICTKPIEMVAITATVDEQSEQIIDTDQPDDSTINSANS